MEALRTHRRETFGDLETEILAQASADAVRSRLDARGGGDLERNAELVAGIVVTARASDGSGSRRAINENG